MTERSPGRILFEEIALASTKADQWRRVDQLVTDAEEESVYLDFKEKPGTTPLTDLYVREKLARSLSGFANTEGGLLVYGIGTNGAPKGTPDKAQRVAHIQDAGRFRTELEKLASRSVYPAISTVDIRSIEDPARPNEGVVLVYVPRSDGGPHRVVGTKADIDEKYFMRTTTEMVVMSHGHLADRFGRSAQPRLELVVRISAANPLRLELRLRNTGRGAARRPALQLNESPGLLDWKLWSQLTTGFIGRTNIDQTGKTRLLWEPHEDVVVYPAMDRVVTTVQYRGSLAVAGMSVRFVGELHALEMQPVLFDDSLVVAPGTDDAAAQGMCLTLPPRTP